MRRIADCIRDRKTIAGYSRVVSRDEIRENGYNLNIPRYVDTFEEEAPIDINEVKANIAKHVEESKAIDVELEKFFKELGI